MSRLQMRHSGGIMPARRFTSKGKIFRLVLRSIAKIKLMAKNVICVSVGAKGFGIESSLYGRLGLSLL